MNILSNKLLLSVPIIAISAALYTTRTDMSTLAAIRSANTAFAAKGVANPVAVFVGGTSGIGAATMRAFAQSTVSPTIYLIGRNQVAGAELTKDLQDLNPSATVTFLQSDISLLSNALATAAMVKEKENRLNLLFLSPGYMSMAGPVLTAEGLEKKMVINYYGRVLFAAALLPLLKASGAADGDLGARVISVYSPGHEGPVVESDMELVRPENFNISQAAKQASAFTSLGFEHLAKENTEVGWVHAYPGVVMTGLLREMPLWFRCLSPALSVFSIRIEDCAQGFLRIATDEKFKTGLGLVDWKGMERDTRKAGATTILGGKGWWREGLAEKVWAHTQDVFERVLGKRV